MKNYRQTMTGCAIVTNESYIGSTIEQELRRISETKEPISSFSPEIFTEKKRGVEPQYNIRTNKWDLAYEAMEKVEQAKHFARKEKEAKVIDINSVKATATDTNTGTGTKPQ